MSLEKIKEAIHTIIQACETPKELGAVKLNKILWFSDVHTYRTTGQSITGVTSYIKRKRGPVHPHILKALDGLEGKKKIHINKNVEPFMSTEYVSLSAPSKENLSAEEISTLTSTTDVITKNYSASEISLMSHNQAWDIANEGESIPLSTSLLLTFGTLPNSVKKWIDGHDKNNR